MCLSLQMVGSLLRIQLNNKEFEGLKILKRSNFHDIGLIDNPRNEFRGPMG